MLRSIYQKGRRRLHVPCSSNDSEDLEVATEIDGEELEPWHEWVQRVTREIELDTRRLNIEDWVTAQRRKHYRWAGHIARRDDQRWTTLILDWEPEGGRLQGGAGKGRIQARPRRRWEDGLMQYYAQFGITWREVAWNRDEWRAHEDAFCKQLW